VKPDVFPTIEARTDFPERHFIAAGDEWQQAGGQGDCESAFHD
jgi:hypothetical protein